MPQQWCCYFARWVRQHENHQQHPQPVLQLGFDASNRVLVQLGGDFWQRLYEGFEGEGRERQSHSRVRSHKAGPCFAPPDSGAKSCSQLQPSRPPTAAGDGQDGLRDGHEPLLPPSCPVPPGHPPSPPAARWTQIPRGLAARRHPQLLPAGERELLVGWEQQPYVNEG